MGEEEEEEQEEEEGLEREEEEEGDEETGEGEEGEEGEQEEAGEPGYAFCSISFSPIPYSTIEFCTYIFRPSTPKVPRKTKPQGKKIPAGKATPKTPQSSKRLANPTPSGPSGSQKKPKPSQASEQERFITLSGDEGAANFHSAVPRKQDERHPKDNSVVIGTFRTREPNIGFWSTNHQIIAFLADVPENEEATAGNLRCRVLPWTTTNNPKAFGLPEHSDGHTHGTNIKTERFRFLTLKKFYHERAYSGGEWTHKKLFEVVRSELELPWYARH
jgi:hypothetical protein